MKINGNINTLVGMIVNEMEMIKKEGGYLDISTVCRRLSITKKECAQLVKEGAFKVYGNEYTGLRFKEYEVMGYIQVNTIVRKYGNRN